MAKKRGKRVGEVPTEVTAEVSPNAKAEIEITTALPIENEEELVEVQDLLDNQEGEERAKIESSGEMKERTDQHKEIREDEQRNKQPWRALFAGNRDGESGLKLEKVNCDTTEVIITREEQEPELEYWKWSLYVYVLGQEIPTQAMVNFLRMKWKGLVMPKVVKQGHGFILRFDSREDMQAGLQKGILFFYSKPVFMQQWRGENERYDELTTVPVWVQLPKLPIGLWGANTLSKLASKLGEPMHTDEMTAKKLRLEYARVLVKVEIGGELPEEIKIIREGREEVLVQPVIYEWLPIKCKNCGKWGHRDGKCIKPVTQVWREKKNDMKEENGGVKHVVNQEMHEGQGKIILTKSTPIQGEKGKEKEWTEVSKSKQKKGHLWADRASSLEVQHALSNLFQVLGQAGGAVEGGIVAQEKPPNI